MREYDWMFVFALACLFGAWLLSMREISYLKTRIEKQDKEINILHRAVDVFFREMSWLIDPRQRVLSSAVTQRTVAEQLEMPWNEYHEALMSAMGEDIESLAKTREELRSKGHVWPSLDYKTWSQKLPSR